MSSQLSLTMEETTTDGRSVLDESCHPWHLVADLTREGWAA
jgi:hypothetical protein